MVTTTGTPGIAIEDKVTTNKLRSSFLLAPAQQSGDTRFQLLKAERLHQIIIGTCVESFYNIICCTLGRKHNDGGIVSIELAVLPA